MRPPNNDSETMKASLDQKSILVMADDDPDDREFVREAFEQSGFAGEFRFVEDGVELIDYLSQSCKAEGPAATPPPDLILLDLNMPRLDGSEALAMIKSDPRLRRIPVVVFSTSSSQEDIEKSYDLGVNSFVTKPASFQELVGIAEGLRRYWMEIVSLPGAAEA